jgi:superfamily II DNA/RNA helicase
VRHLADRGICSPFPIQTATLPDSMAGRDVLGRGRTGSGKTLAFTLPLVTRLAERPRARPRRPTGLVLVPTRELASQVADVASPLAEAAGLRVTTVFGGVPAGRQMASLNAGADVVVACPGRLEDLASSGHVRLDDIDITVLDEADHMADLGFLPAVRRLLDATAAGTQRLLFSATLDGGVDVLVRRYLSAPVVHEVDAASSPVAEMTHHVLHVSRDHRVPVVADLAAAPGRTIVFTRTKRGARALTRQLRTRGVAAVELHGDLTQSARTRNLDAFAAGRAGTLVATDIAARGIHVDDVAMVVHADPPVEHRAYLHRSGRTARAGESGTVVTIMADDQAGDVRTLMRRAGIRARTTRVAGEADPLLRVLAPGARDFRTGSRDPAQATTAATRARRGAPRRASRSATSRGSGRPAGGAAPTSMRAHSAAGFSAGTRGRR